MFLNQNILKCDSIFVSRKLERSDAKVVNQRFKSLLSFLFQRATELYPLLLNPLQLTVIKLLPDLPKQTLISAQKVLQITTQSQLMVYILFPSQQESIEYFLVFAVQLLLITMDF